MTTQTSEVSKSAVAPMAQPLQPPQPPKKDSYRIVNIVLTVLFHVIPLVLAVGGFNFLAIRCIAPLFTKGMLRDSIRIAVTALASGVALLVNGTALRALYRVTHNGFNMFVSRHAVRA